MKHYAFLICAIVLGGLCQGQNPQNLIPHPYVGVAAELMGGGYAPFAVEGMVGVQVESRWFSFDANAAYDNGHKEDDGTSPNPKGHDRYLAGTAYLRLPSSWFVGAGARWSQISTTNYKKSGWRPTFGGGKDVYTDNCLEQNCVGHFNFRLAADYILPGTDWQNGSQGPAFSIWFPSPSVRKHVYFKETIDVLRYHDTVTDRSDLTLTRQQQANRHSDCFVEFALIFRF